MKSFASISIAPRSLKPLLTLALAALPAFAAFPNGYTYCKVVTTQHAMVSGSADLSNYPLTVIVQPNQELMLRSFYYRSRFSDETIARLLQHFRIAMEEIARAADRKIRDIHFLTAIERR